MRPSLLVGAPGFYHDLTCLQPGKLWRVRRDQISGIIVDAKAAEYTRDAKLRGIEVERAHDRFVVAADAHLHQPPQLAPHNHVAFGHHFGPGVHIPEDTHVAAIAHRLARL